MQLNETPLFLDLLQCVRAGDLEKTSSLVENFSVELNCVDQYDYSPLILASLCGHIEIVKYLLEHGAILERDTFDGARCLYGALNDEIRNLLLKYDASTAVDVLQPFAAHLSALRRDNLPLTTSDIDVYCGSQVFRGHRFLLAARSPWLAKCFEADAINDRLAFTENQKIFDILHRWLYVDHIEMDADVDDLRDLMILAKKLGLTGIVDFFLDETVTRRQKIAEQSRQAQEDMEIYVQRNVIDQSWTSGTTGINSLSLSRDSLLKQSTTFADALIAVRVEGDVIIYPVSKGMLIKSEFFLAALTSGFAEAQDEIPSFTLDTSKEVAEIVLRFLYVDKVDIPRRYALDVITIANYLLLDKERSLKSLAAISVTNDDEELPPDTDVYSILRVAWLTETPRLEQYAAKYIADHLESYLHQQEFREIVLESAGRIANRQETDTIELIDDIRFYLSKTHGIYFAMNNPGDSAVGEAIKEDLWVPLTPYEIRYNEQLEKLDDLLATLSLDA